MAALDFQQWLESFFAREYHRRPVSATFIGAHDYDHALPDWSWEGAEAADAEAAALLGALDRLDAEHALDALDPIERIDRRLAEGHLRIRRWEHASGRFRGRNPSLWIGEATFGLIGLLLTDYAPLAERLEAAMARMEAMPGFLGQAERELAGAPAAWIERAREECLGARLLVERGLDEIALPPSIVPERWGRARAAAAQAIARFVALMERLPAAATNSVAAGEEALTLLLRHGHCLEQSPDEIAAYAEEQIALAVEERARRAAALGLTHWQEGLERLAALHPEPAGYLPRFQELWDASRAHAAAHDLLTWPEFPLRYVERPRWARAAAPFLYFLFYRAPAALRRPPVHDYLVAPLPDEGREQFLRATNESVIKLNHVVHHGGIGHHVQNWHAYRAPSRIGRIAAVDCAARIALFCGGTMAEGWACYATTLMEETGFLTPLEALSEAHGRIRMAARAYVDVRLHQGRMSLDEAARFYAERAAMPAAAARSEAVKNSIFPGAALIYLIGHDSIMDLRAEFQRAQGERFSLRAFHDRFLSYGSIPVALIAQEMRKELTHAAAAQ